MATMAMSTSASLLSVEDQAWLVESAKRQAATQAVCDHLCPTDKYIGIGSGTTVCHVVDAIAALGPATTSAMRFYATGEQSESLIRDAGLTLAHIQDLPADIPLDVCFDGADEVDADLNLIKGGGACLWQEKVVATAARRFICVADFRKTSPRLGTNWKKGIPIEVLPKSAPRVLAELRRLGAIDPRIRSGLPAKAGSVVTDNGMLLIDAPFPPLLLPSDLAQRDVKAPPADVDGTHGGLWTVDALADRLIKIVGVVEVGLFTGKNGLERPDGGAQKPIAAYFGMQDGSVKIQVPSSCVISPTSSAPAATSAAATSAAAPTSSTPL